MSRWDFTRADPSPPGRRFFRTDLRQISGEQSDKDLPWQDDMYLAYPSLEKPSWPALVAHVGRLNAQANTNTRYKIVYIMRRAHKCRDEIDPPLDDRGKQQCGDLAANLNRAMQDAGLPAPELILTSPLTRALETTQLGIAPLFPSARLLVLDSLRERMRGVGKCERRGKDWISQKFPGFDLGHVDESDRLGLQYKNSAVVEPYEDLWYRVQGALSDVFEQSADTSVVLLMSHCYVLQTIQREIDGWDVQEEQKTELVEFFVGEARGYAMVVRGVRR